MNRRKWRAKKKFFFVVTRDHFRLDFIAISVAIIFFFLQPTYLPICAQSSRACHRVETLNNTRTQQFFIKRHYVFIINTICFLLILLILLLTAHFV